MTLKSLTAEDRDIVLKCLSATLDHFDFDFETRLGITPDAMRRVIAAWPHIDDSGDDSEAALAIHNTLNDLLNGAGLDDTAFIRLTGAGRSDIARICRQWSMDPSQARRHSTHFRS